MLPFELLGFFSLVCPRVQSYWTLGYLFLSMLLLGVAIFPVRLLEILSCFLITLYSTILVITQIYNFPIATKISPIAFDNSSFSEFFNLFFYSSWRHIIFIAISAADIVGLFFIKSSILSELFLFLSELFEVVSELFLFLSELFEAVSELNNWKSLFWVSYFCNLTWVRQIRITLIVYLLSFELQLLVS